MNRQQGKTNTASGLRKATEILQSSSGYKVGVLITDQAPNVEKGRLVPDAKDLKDSGALLMVCAIGSENLEDDFKDVPTQDPGSSNRYFAQVEKFKNLPQIKERMLNVIVEPRMGTETSTESPGERPGPEPEK